MKKISLVLSLLFLAHILCAQDQQISNKKKPNNKRPKVGLILSGGGAKGFAYIGLFKVLHEVGLRIDYIGGTSIGSIMGGLYAVGYSPEAMEDMIRAQDWTALITDKIPRRFKAYEEKNYTENTIVAFPINKRKIAMKRSLYQGQLINLLLNRYFSPAWSIRDFNELQTPFFMCWY